MSTFSPAVESPGREGPSGPPQPGDREARSRSPRVPEAGRQLRKDAERNRQRILDAAAEVFTERGLEVSLDEVARHAGVGVGTVYRRFTDKDELVATLFTERINEVAAIAKQALKVADPWEGLVWFLQQFAEKLADNVGLRQLMLFASYADDHVCYARQTMVPLSHALVERAKASGQARADLAPTDIPFIALMMSSVSEYAQHSRPDVWRRYLTLVIDGMCSSRDGTTPLPAPALGPDEMEITMRQRIGRDNR
jgi:AcrR family transcriptional regulator